MSGLSSKFAHASLMPSLVGNKDLAVLQELITTEKAVMNGLQKLATDYAKAAEALKAWGAGEGDDLGVSGTSDRHPQLASALQV